MAKLIITEDGKLITTESGKLLTVDELIATIISIYSPVFLTTEDGSFITTEDGIFLIIDESISEMTVERYTALPLESINFWAKAIVEKYIALPDTEKLSTM